MTYRIRLTKQAGKDIRKRSPKLRSKLEDILRNRLAIFPHAGKPLAGELKGYYSVRLSYQDRIVYTVHDDELIVVVVWARTHYGD